MKRRINWQKTRLYSKIRGKSMRLSMCTRVSIP
ncbi:MAG: hypothetical protein LBS34_01800 [Rickettsiales bacterium]|nr:hypothetical protein [Rickettsiales bacterium]